MHREDGVAPFEIFDCTTLGLGIEISLLSGPKHILVAVGRALVLVIWKRDVFGAGVDDRGFVDGRMSAGYTF